MNDDELRNRALKDDNDVDEDPEEGWILDRPSKKLKISNTSSKVELLSQSNISPFVNPTNSDLIESLEDGALLESSVLSPYVKPTNNDLIDELCLYISIVDDVPSLE